MCTCVRGREQTFDPGQSGCADDAKPGQVIGHLLLVGVVTTLHPSLIQGVVIVEDKLEDVPEQTSVEELGLQPGVHTEG